MKTYQPALWALVALAITLMAACGTAPPALSPIVSPVPTVRPEPSLAGKLVLVGRVDEVAADQLLVTDVGGNQAWITVSAETELFGVMADATRPVAFEALRPGQQVEIRLSGALHKSNPMQANAQRITITAGAESSSAIPESADIVQIVMQVLRQQIPDSEGQLRFVKAEAVEWPDACLGLTDKDIMCAQVITPGYRVVLAVGSTQYIYHTDQDGSRVALASGPEARVPDAAVTWRGEGARGCMESALGSKVVAFGACGGAQMEGRYTRPDRAEAFAYYTATYAPFEAETPAGYLRFDGQGSTDATLAEQRMIAEWARWSAIEASAGRSGASYGFAMAWSRTGGIAGLCDHLEVYATGDVFVSTCAAEPAKTLAHGYLSTAEAEQLFIWIDTLEGFEIARSDWAVADSMTTGLLFGGGGSAERSTADEDAMLAYAAALFARIAPQQ